MSRDIIQLWNPRGPSVPEGPGWKAGVRQPPAPLCRETRPARHCHTCRTASPWSTPPGSPYAGHPELLKMKKGFCCNECSPRLIFMIWYKKMTRGLQVVPVVTLLKVMASAVLPPRAMHMRSNSCSLVNKCWSRGRIWANPRAAFVRGAMDTWKTNWIWTSFHQLF